jgi:expansin (peptidoglycan-binding protein)
MTPTIKTIRTALKTALNVLTGNNGKLNYLYDTYDADAEGHPYALFDLSDNEADFLTNKENERIVAWQVVVFTHTSMGNREAALLLDDITDDIIALLEGDFNLGGAVDWCEPLVGTRQRFSDTKEGYAIGQLITVRCHISTDPL